MRPHARNVWIAGALAGTVLVAAAMSSTAEAERPSQQTPATRPVRATEDAGSTRSADPTRPTTGRPLLPPSADVWTPPQPLGAGAHGDLIQAQRVVPTPIGLGAAYRVLYRSVAPDGEAVVVSGVVFRPRGVAPRGGWPVISWARGTSGTADRCAPSRSIGDDTVPIDLARAGFLVAATDYQGLGTSGLQPYLVGTSEGRAVLDIVRAADSLPGVTAQRAFSLWGHSQGGHAVLFARELAAEWLPNRDLAATVAMAPPAFIPQFVDTWLRVPAKALGLMTLAGLAETSDRVRLDQIIAPSFLAPLRAALDTGCTEDVNHMFATVDPAQLFIADPATTGAWPELLHAQEPVQRPGIGPVLLVHGELDATLPAAMSQAIETQLCRAGEPVERWVMPGQGHGEIIGGTWGDMVRWTRARLDGRALTTTSCDRDDDRR